jgi:two-component system chemotaxis response regulator CheY
MAEILIADDDESLRELLAEVLTDAGHQVTQAGDGRVAISLLRQRSFAVVVTDMLMPDADGAEVLAALRGRQPKPWLVVISGGGSIDAASYLQMARVFGADEVLQKPFPPSQLIALLGRLLAQPRAAPG